MGQTLSSPDTEKHIKAGGNDKFAYALCEMQGWRTSMEDAHAIELNLDEKDDTNAFFAVYDGHGGSTVAKYSGENLHKRLLIDEAYKREKWEAALKNAFLGTDADIRAGEFWDPSGCTAIAALVTHDGRIFVANAGDSRAVISIKGEVKPLSFDHKPMNRGEMLRIENAGGYIDYGRVNGNLALSRALGDFEFKKNPAMSPEQQIITADPEITEHKLESEEEFLVLACDGIWDCLQSQQVTDIVRLQVSEGKKLEEIASFLCDHCLAPDTVGPGLGCDNMTVLIVALLNGRTKEEWYAWVTDRVKNKYGYATPTELPQLYAPSRLSAFKAQKAAHDERMARGGARGGLFNDNNDEFGGLSSVFGGRAVGVGGPLGFARSMLGTGVQFHPASTNMDDSDDDSEDEDEDIMLTLPDADDAAEKEKDEEFFRGLGMRTPVGDITKSLRAQLDELEDSESPVTSELHDEEISNPGDEALQAFGAKAEENGASSSYSKTETTTTNGLSAKKTGGEAPPPPTSLVNGDLKIQQLELSPGGDKAAPVVEAEGLMDKSDSTVEVN